MVQKIVAMTLLADGTVFVFLDADSPGPVHIFDWFFFWRIRMNPRFINSYITSRKFLWIMLKHAQTLLRRNHSSQLVIGCEKTRHPSCRQLPHAQTFMLNVPYASNYNVYSLTYLTHFIQSSRSFLEKSPFSDCQDAQHHLC